MFIVADFASLNRAKREKNYTATFYFCDKVLDKSLKCFPDIQQRFVETPSICLFWCLGNVPFSVLSFIHWILQMHIRKK